MTEVPVQMLPYAEVWPALKTHRFLAVWAPRLDGIDAGSADLDGSNRCRLAVVVYPAPIGVDSATSVVLRNSVPARIQYGILTLHGSME